jgi:hypothetical protein
MSNKRADPDTDRLWQEFHELVNVTSAQLQAWLMTASADEQGAVDDVSRQVGDGPGRQVAAILAKRKVDLTDHDIQAMDDVVERIRDLLDRRPPDGASDDAWRHALLSLGHDPLQAPAGAE